MRQKSSDFLTFRAPAKVIFGQQALELLGEEVAFLGKKCLVVTGMAAMRKHRITDKALEILVKAGIGTFCYEGVEMEPTVDAVDAGLEAARKNNCDVVAGIGGGSVLDVAKAIAGLFNEKGRTIEFHRDKEITTDGIPFVAVPTTSGTGSESTNNSVLIDRERNIKKSIRRPGFIARVAIVDPSLTLSLPPKQTAASGMDALTHAIEAYVSTGSSGFTDGLAEKAIELIALNIKEAFKNPYSVQARSGMAMGSLCSGISFANAGLGACHALAHPIGARYGVEHGVVNAALLPHVIKYNLNASSEKFTRAAALLAGGGSHMMKVEAHAAIEMIHNLDDALELPLRLRHIKVRKEDLKVISEEAIISSSSWKTNPRALNKETLLEILETAY